MKATIVTAAAVVVLVTGCGTTSTTAGDEPSTAPPSSPSLSGSVSGSVSASAAAQPTEEDLALARALEALSNDPGPETLAQVPFAPEVALGLARRLEPPRARDQLAARAGWSIDAAQFRGYVGPFNALEHLDGARVDVEVGPQPHCAGPPVPAPPGLESLHRVVLQPAAGTIDSCLDWFSVDLFVDDGTVVAVTLDLWEP
jgi:hypothetical protein